VPAQPSNGFLNTHSDPLFFFGDYFSFTDLEMLNFINGKALKKKIKNLLDKGALDILFLW